LITGGKERKGKCRNLTCNPKADYNQPSLSYESNKKDEESKTEKKPEEQLSPEMVIKIREICPKKEGGGKGESLTQITLYLYSYHN